MKSGSLFKKKTSVGDGFLRGLALLVVGSFDSHSGRFNFNVPTSVYDDLANLHILPHLLPELLPTKNHVNDPKDTQQHSLASFFFPPEFCLKELTIRKKHRSHATESWRCIELGDGGHQIQIW